MDFNKLTCRGSREKNARVGDGGANPSRHSNANVAQLVERLPSKQIVVGSSPIIRSNRFHGELVQP